MDSSEQVFLIWNINCSCNINHLPSEYCNHSVIHTIWAYLVIPKCSFLCHVVTSHLRGLYFQGTKHWATAHSGQHTQRLCPSDLNFHSGFVYLYNRVRQPGLMASNLTQVSLQRPVFEEHSLSSDLWVNPCLNALWLLGLWGDRTKENMWSSNELIVMVK